MEKEKSIYFYVTYSKKQKENDIDIDYIVPEKKDLQPKCIFVDEIYKNQFYYYNKIFKVNSDSGKGKKRNNFYFEFEINDEKYVISFDSKGKTFIYEVNLEVGKRIIIIKRKINQKKEYYQTMEYFIKAFENDKQEEDLLNDFYKETIELYSIKKGFPFLIELFLKIYKKNNLCPLLLEVFKKMNENPKENSKNMEKPQFLKEHIKIFNSIKNEANNIIKENAIKV